MCYGGGENRVRLQFEKQKDDVLLLVAKKRIRRKLSPAVSRVTGLSLEPVDIVQLSWWRTLGQNGSAATEATFKVILPVFQQAKRSVKPSARFSSATPILSREGG